MTELAIANVPPADPINNPPIGSAPDTPVLQPTVRQIARLVAAYYGHTPEQIFGASRSRKLVQTRWMAMFLAHRITGQSSAFIGRFMGDKDHSAVLHAIREIPRRIAVNPSLAEQYHDLYDRLTTGFWRQRS